LTAGAPPRLEQPRGRPRGTDQAPEPGGQGFGNVLLTEAAASRSPSAAQAGRSCRRFWRTAPWARVPGARAPVSSRTPGGNGLESFRVDLALGSTSRRVAAGWKGRGVAESTSSRPRAGGDRADPGRHALGHGSRVACTGTRRATDASWIAHGDVMAAAASPASPPSTMVRTIRAIRHCPEPGSGATLGRRGGGC